MTKSTGGPRGRPRKAAAPKEPRPCSSRRLAADPDRYLLAITQAVIEAGPRNGVSERRIVETFAGLRYGRLKVTYRTFEEAKRNLGAAFADNYYEVDFRGGPYKLKGWVGEALKACLPGETVSAAPGWLHQTIFRPYADDNLRKRLRRIRAKPPSDPDRRWLAAMVKAWRVCFDGDVRLSGHAEALAATAGELAYFRERMRPMLYAKFANPELFFPSFLFISLFGPHPV
jgi:hypothetical protein